MTVKRTAANIIFALALVLAVAFAAPAGWGLFTVPVYADVTDVPEIQATSGILIDAKTGDVLYYKDEHLRLEPASCTKMITCLLALENLPLDEVITIDAETPKTEGNSIHLAEGEEITVENLLYGLMLESANDAAVALAIRIAGNTDDFAVMMNESARELGAVDTTFVNPNGLHQEGHMSTAYDLAMVAKGCMRNTTFRQLVSTERYTIPATNMSEARDILTTNRLLYDEETVVPSDGKQIPAKYDGAIGIKTGYTSRAQGCLAAGAERGGTELIAVVLHSTDLGRFGDCRALLDYGFENYRTLSAGHAGEDMGAYKVRGGAEKTVPAILADDAYVTLAAGLPDDTVTTAASIDAPFKAPVTAGQVLGQLEVYRGETLLEEIDILAASEVTEGGILSKVTGALSFFDRENAPENRKGVVKLIAAIVIAVAVIMIVFSVINRLRRRKRRRERAMRIALERRGMRPEDLDERRRGRS